MPALPGQCEEWSGERRPEGAALNKYGNSNHGAGAACSPSVISVLGRGYVATT